MGQPEIGAHREKKTDVLVSHHSERLIGVPHGGRRSQQMRWTEMQVGLGVGRNSSGIVPEKWQIGNQREHQRVPATKSAKVSGVDISELP